MTDVRYIIHRGALGVLRLHRSEGTIEQDAVDEAAENLFHLEGLHLLEERKKHRKQAR